jgi:hypothetical protein
MHAECGRAGCVILTNRRYPNPRAAAARNPSTSSCHPRRVRLQLQKRRRRRSGSKGIAAAPTSRARAPSSLAWRRSGDLYASRVSPTMAPSYTCSDDIVDKFELASQFDKQCTYQFGFKCRRFVNLETTNS